jgi:hypothetical protein
LSLYARGAIGDYWILDLVSQRLEVYRDPVRDPTMPFGWRYALVIVLGHGDAVSPLAARGARVSVSDLLP